MKKEKKNMFKCISIIRGLFIYMLKEIVYWWSPWEGKWEWNEYIFLSIILINGIGVASCMSGVFESGTTAILPGSYNGLLML